MAWHYLDMADFLLPAEAVLDIPAEDLSTAPGFVGHLIVRWRR
jgi:hypothetical protein